MMFDMNLVSLIKQKRDFLYVKTLFISYNNLGDKMNDTNKSLIGIVIDPGHGGIDGGASGNNQNEKDYTLKISKYMYDRFKELGIPVSITRDTDITLSPNDRTNKILSFYGNNPNVIVVSNHLNAGGGEFSYQQ